VSDRLRSRPASPTEPAPGPGEHGLGIGGERDARLVVPAGHDPSAPAALVVLLHGAGSSGAALLPVAAAARPDPPPLLLSPDSRGPTWDVIRGGFGPDVGFLDAALAWVFARFAVDPGRTVLGGFSDGASYALSLGLGNGDLFGRLVAFSPGFLAPDSARGRPEIFVSHGTEDRVLPIDRCSRRIVPGLRRAGYEVTYEEFAGGHTVPPGLARAALARAVR
jgi:phospholipase/carboxylesterase